jgi:hypothetical protein
MTLSYNGDISFYEDTGTTAKFFWDASAESLGIGLTSPQAGLDLDSSAKGTWSSGNVYSYPSGNAYIKVQGTAAEDDWIGIAGNYNQSSGSANLLLQANLRLVNEQAGNYIGSEAQSVTSADITFGKLVGGSSTGVNATKSEFMRINSSGIVMVATTNTNPHTFTTGSGLSINSAGMLNAAKQAAVVQILNRTGNSDGVIQEYKKDGTTVGSIGTRISDLTIGTGDVGLRFVDSLDTIWAVDTADGTSRDGAVDLGETNVRFKDLYLSGTLTNDGTGGISIDTSGNVGIGTTSPAQLLDLTQSSSGAVVNPLILRNPNSAVSGTGTKIYFSCVPDNNRGSYIESASGASNATYLAFATNAVGADATERVRIDSSGNLLVGTTNVTHYATSTTQGHSLFANGTDTHSASGGKVGVFNRQTSDGDIVEFRKDGTIVGSIGTSSGDLVINNCVQIDGPSGGLFLTGSIEPTNGTSRVDNSIDLGSASYRFDDIYAT